MLDKYLARMLPPDEWHRLGIAPELLPRDPDRAVIMVVEDEAGGIIARWMAYDTTVLEGLFVAPAHRHHPGVAGRLLQAMTAELVGRNVAMAITLIEDPEVMQLAERHGLYSLPGQLWVLDLRQLLAAGAAPPDPQLKDNAEEMWQALKPKAEQER
jgi:hypothetical protein